MINLTVQSTKGQVSSWLLFHQLPHRPRGFDYQGVEIIEIRSQDWPIVATGLYVYGFNYLRCQCAYDVGPGNELASVYYLTKVSDLADQPEELCIKIFVSRTSPYIPSIFWVWKSADFQERESFDMFGIVYTNHPHLTRILMPDSWLGWPLRKDYITPNFYELQDSY
jgi:NAD(P)H-quinone oxidoreductase subunit J